jgi:hypothetical protein
MITGTAGISFFKIRVSSKPFMRGMERSVTIRAGWSRRARFQAAAYDAGQRKNSMLPFFSDSPTKQHAFKFAVLPSH